MTVRSKPHPEFVGQSVDNNFHTATARYKPFADLIGNDGYQVIPNKETFSVDLLKDGQVLIIEFMI